jgi:hypothetical protein
MKVSVLVSLMVEPSLVSVVAGDRQRPRRHRLFAGAVWNISVK